MLKSRRSSTPSGSGRGGVEDGKNRPSKIPKKISSSSLQQFIQNEDAASSNPSAAYKKHHSTSSVPQKVQLFENSPNNKKNSKPKENGDISHYRKSVDEETKKWWDSVVESVFISDSNNVRLHFELCGGADDGQFPFIGAINNSDLAKIGLHVSGGVIQEGDVLLEVQGQKISGYTAADVSRWFKHCLQNKNPVVVRTVPKGAITTDLRQYLNTRFPKGDVDHELQNTIRDNLYLRTVPVTTRTPRPEERHGVDYTFLSKEEFAALEKSGELLESGIYDGNHYGTPKPSTESKTTGSTNAPSRQPDESSSTPHSGGVNNFPGAHPSSEGKRRRNRSNVEAMTAKNLQEEVEKEDINHPNGTSPETPSGGSTSTTKSAGSTHAVDSGHPDSPDVTDVPISTKSNHVAPPSDSNTFSSNLIGDAGQGEDLGPLPPNWEKAYTDKGEPYFIDHTSGTSHWLDPRLSRVQKRRAEECDEDELPFGWERIDDPHYGTYFIDHVNRKTQYENPVLVARAVNQSGDAIVAPDEHRFPPPVLPTGHIGPPPPQAPTGDSSGPGTFPRSKKSHSPFFTRDPALLRGDHLRCQLVKSSRGLGFTIVGGDDNVDEFLQIKSVVPNGPAWTDGLLKTGDVLVYVNETCVLGFTHADMVSMFQSIQSGETVNLEVCRGYPLPFDPDDPNTEIVTTVAVTSPDQGDWANELERQRFAANSTNPVDVQSMPDLSANSQGSVSGANIVNRPGSADLLDYGKNDDVFDSPPKSNGNLRQEDIATVPITKGGMGFGFTIADSAYGQKVKKILDRPRCKTLQEGDILVEINGVSVRGMSHSEVVQVLKECSRGQEANITIQRGHTLSQGSSSSPIKNKYKSKKDSDIMKPKSGFLFRSKTPTAELYASASKEKENLPNRPKTPIVDTRNMRSKTPTSLAGGGTPFQRNDITRASLGGSANVSNSYYNSMLDQMNGMHMSNGQNMNQHQVDAVHHLQQQQFQRSKSPGNELENGYQGYQSSMQPQGQYGQYNGYQQTIPNSQQYNPAVEYNHQNYVQYPMPSGNPQVAGYPADTFQEPGYGYTSASGGINYSPSGAYRSGGGYRAGSLPRGNQNTYPNNGILARKESTSFEHSEPLPGGLTRWPRPERRPNHVAPNSMVNTEWVEMSVALQRQDSGFGFRIVGGTEESSQVSIGHIVPDGAADVDGRLFSGDEIVAVDNVNVLNASHHQVVGLMGAAAQSGQVTITVRRRIYQQDGYGRPIANSNEIGSGSVAPTISYPYDITVSRRENEGFGFVIISSASRAGSTIGRIIAGSPAERCGRLHVGDRILAVNHVDIAGMHHGDIVNLIKDSGYSVVMTVGHPIDDASSTASTSHREEQELNLLELDDQYYAVELSRGGRGFGFSIRGGREFQSMPLFVLRIAVDGPAAADGRLRVGDQIVEINGVNTKNMTHADAIDLIKSGGTSVRLLVRRSNSGGKVPPLIDHIGGMSPLSPTPNPMMSTTASASAMPIGVHSGLGHARPVSAMSQPTTSSMHLQNLSGNVSSNISAANNINQNISSHLPQGNASAVPTSSGNTYQLPPGAMPLPGMTQTTGNGSQQPPNGIPPHMQQPTSTIQNGMIHHYGVSQQYPNGGPMSHSSPRVGGDQYYWNQY